MSNSEKTEHVFQEFLLPNELKKVKALVHEQTKDLIKGHERGNHFNISFHIWLHISILSTMKSTIFCEIE